MKTENVDGLLLDHHEPEGARRSLPLLLVHGLWGDAWVWDEWAPFAASRGWDTWVMHHRGRSGSRPVPDLGKVRLRDLVSDVQEVLVRIGPAVIVGYSMGGLVTQRVSAVDDRVRAAVYLSTVPPGNIVSVNPWMARRLARFLPAILGGKPFAPRRPDADVLLFNRTPSERVDRLFPKLIPDSGTIAREIMFGSLKIDASRIRCPRLIVSTGEDRISPPSLQPKLVRMYRAEHLAFPGLDHMHTLHPDWGRVAAPTLDWLERIVAGPIASAP